jgi:hypothetical protein
MRGSWGRINDIEAKYYADSEDAYDMRKMLKPKSEKAGAEGKSEASKRVPVEKAGERTSKDKEENSRKPKTNNDEGVTTELLEKDHGKKSVDISVKQTSTGGGAG